MTRKEAEALISAIVLLRETVSDEQALSAVALYPHWKPNVFYPEGNRVQHNSVLYKCVQVHTAQDSWSPDATPALWVAISVDAGTQDKPIEAVRGMEYEEGKYYLDTEDGGTYLCTRSAVLQYLPHELVGHYFDKV